jgi:hypothetical protein
MTCGQDKRIIIRSGDKSNGIDLPQLSRIEFDGNSVVTSDTKNLNGFQLQREYATAMPMWTAKNERKAVFGKRFSGATTFSCDIQA